MKNTLKSLWADLIFKARNIHQMSQTELAEELQAKGHSVDNTLISGIENDCRMPGPEIREDLLTILNIDGRVGYEANLEVWDLSGEDNKKEKIDIESFVDISPH